MNFEWDEHKRKTNLEKHGVDFAVAYQLWNSPMLVKEDLRRKYSEQRWIAMGLLGVRTMLIVFTKRGFDIIRIISFRKANQREVKVYEQAISKTG